MSPRFPQVLAKYLSTDPWLSWADPEGETGGPDPLKNHKKFGFLSNTGPDLLKNHKATKPALFGHYRPASLWHNFLDPSMVVLQRVVFSKRYT